MANEILIIQNELYERLQKAEINYKKTPKERLTTAYIETKLQTLEELWHEYKNGHKKLISIVPKSSKETLTYFITDTYDMFEEQYTTYKTILKTALNARANKPTSSYELTPESMKTSEIPLPQIQLPTFNGKYEEWQSFYDMFVSLIHDNTKLSNVQKLHYLKANLIGEPETLLRNFAITEQNYEEAWKQLVKRYNNKRYNANAILKNLFTQKTITTESANALKQLLDTTTSCLQSLENIGIDTKSCDAFIVYLVVCKLDTESHKLWEQMLSSTTDLPTWAQLTEFLESRFRSIEMIEPGKQLVKSPVSNTIKKYSKPRSFHSAVQEITKPANGSCALCDGSHYVYHCQQFEQKSIQERIDFVQHKRLCFNCMCPNHIVKKCRQTTSCRKCGKKHHTMLHIEKNGSTQNKESNTNERELHYNTQQKDKSNNEMRIVANFSQEIQSHNVLLATAIINAHASNGEKYIIRALLDQGSQASFISESTVQLLKLKRTPVSGVVSGLGDEQTRIKYSVSLLLESRYNPTAKYRVNAYVLGVLTSLIPGNKLCASEWVELKQLKLADPGYANPGKIDILLGADVYSEILYNDMVKQPEGNLIAQLTAFGWVLSGRIMRDTPYRERIINMHIQMRSDEILRKFWEIESEPDLIKKKLTVEEEMCERFYERTTARNEKGRFIVRLPFKVDEPKCQYGDTRKIAERKLLFLEKRLEKDTNLRREYEKVIEEYLTLNHMELVPLDDLENSRANYLPHHAVVKEERETTKVVMNASSKGTSGVSLNDELLVGPKIQQDLRHILMRWRTHPICIIADLVKMYRQVLVHKDDANFQRILWRSNTNMPIQHYKLITLTFGTHCAPYLAVKTLQRLADEEKMRYPIAAEITKNDYYVDDLMTGCDTKNEAIQIYDEMNLLMNSEGFQVQKWSSNSTKLLQYIKQDKHSAETSVPIKSDNMLKVLGICWNRQTDSFEYTINLPEKKGAITKRQILSDVARLHDPLGWIAPVVIRAKIFLQVWKAQLDWDDELTDELLEEWLKYRSELIETETITIPRWLNCTKECKLELHAFSDASTSGFAAVVYIRVINQFNQVYSSIVSAKTKVAPIDKELSVPRLELCGAVLAAKLISEISQVMNIPKQQFFAWTDSTIVLAWLKGGASRWTTFVVNRVSEILNYEQRVHVTMDINIADCVSRGLRLAELRDNILCWHGPSWIHDVNLKNKHDKIPETEEEQNIKSMNIIQDKNKEFDWTKFSNLHRVSRVIKYCKRILHWRKPKKERDKLPNYITTREINDDLHMSMKQAHFWNFDGLLEA